MKKKFLRTDYMRHSKLGKNRRKLQKWRRPKGRHNKTRENRVGYPKSPKIGYKKPVKISGKLNGLIPLRVENLRELEKASKKNIIIVGKVGARKKLELIKRADELKLDILNVGRGKKNAVE